MMRRRGNLIASTSKTIPIIRRTYLFGGAPIVLVAGLAMGILPWIRSRFMLAGGMLILAAMFLFAAWQLVTLRGKVRRLKRRVMESDGCICIYCGYSLVGLDDDAGQCPECGRDFVIADVREAWGRVRYDELERPETAFKHIVETLKEES